jgi:Fe-S-cluster containining protein
MPRVVDGRPFDCTKCGACCSWEGAVYLVPDDIKRLTEFQGGNLPDFINKHVTKLQGRDILKNKSGTKDCTFLDGNRTCSVWDARPKQCDEFPIKFDSRCPGFHGDGALQRGVTMEKQEKDLMASVSENLYKELQAGVKVANVASKAIEEGIDAFFDPNRVKVASMDDLFAFNRVDKDHLIHKASRDLWSIETGKDGSVEVTRLFNSSGEPIKG